MAIAINDAAFRSDQGHARLRSSVDCDSVDLAIADALVDRSYAIFPDFAAQAHWHALAAELQQAHATGRLQRAGVGVGRRYAVREAVRCDLVQWIDTATATPAQRDWLERIEALRLALNRELMLGLFELECHFTVYPPGGFYRRHRDRLAGDTRRAVSWVLYLNRDWQQEHGGALRLHVDEGALDVLPTGGTFVTFVSETFEHEVLPASRERYALTGWFRRRD